MSSTKLILESLAIGAPRTAGNLTLAPLSTPIRWSGPELILLEDALAAGFAFEEVEGEGSVSELIATNPLDRDVLLLEGEQILGLKQNRAVLAATVVPAGETMAIPVSCTERGRWSRRLRPVSAAGATLMFSARLARLAAWSRRNRRATNRVEASLLNSHDSTDSQGKVWRHIERKLAAMRVGSATSSLADCEEASVAEREVYDALLAEEPAHDEIGAAFLLDGRLVAIELLATPDLWRRARRKLLGSYALEAVLPRRVHREPPARRGRADSAADGDLTTAAWLHRLLEDADTTQHEPAVGSGVFRMLRSRAGRGRLLEIDGHMVHGLVAARR